MLYRQKVDSSCYGGKSQFGSYGGIKIGCEKALPVCLTYKENPLSRAKRAERRKTFESERIYHGRQFIVFLQRRRKRKKGGRKPVLYDRARLVCRRHRAQRVGKIDPCQAHVRNSRPRIGRYIHSKPSKRSDFSGLEG